MMLNWNRILSGALVAIYIIGASVTNGARGGFIVFGYSIFPLACIWFSEAMGNYQGLSWDIWINAPSPGIIVCILGWLLLFLPVVILILAFAGA